MYDDYGEFHPEIGDEGEVGEAGNIPTVYSSVLFRSRLEARWAVFFDRVGISWVYEPEQFHVGSSRYTPDFLLEGYGAGGMYAEIKPRDLKREELDKVVELSLRHEKEVLVLSDGMAWEDDWWKGVPSHALYRHHWGFRGTSQGSYVHRYDVTWAECIECKKIWVCEYSEGYNFAHDETCVEGEKTLIMPSLYKITPKVKDAAMVARTFKFR